MSISVSYTHLDVYKRQVWQRAPAAAYDTFAIRFYAWSVHLFAEDSLRASANASTDARALFPRFTREIEERLPELPAFAQQIAMVESLLMRALQKGESKQTAAERTFLTAVSEILYRLSLIHI